MGLKRYLKGLIKILNDPNDPIKHCRVYKVVGCAHVDGPLCNVKTCDITVTQVIKPNSTKVIPEDERF